MNRAEILSHALFDSGGEIDGIKFGPLSQACIMILGSRKNCFFVESNRQQSQSDAVFEIFFVLTRTKEQRTALIRDSSEEWNTKVMEFSVGLEDYAITRFADEYFTPAWNALILSRVESEQPGKLQRSRPTSSSSRKEQGVSGFMISPKPSELKTRSGISPRAASCNSSTPKPSAKAQGSGGPTGPSHRKKSSTNLKNSRTAK
jgi:hypothetical protein